MKVKRSAVALLTLAIVSFACTDDGGEPNNPGGSSASPRVGGDLIIARGADSTTLNKEIAADNPSIWVLQQIMEPLYTVSADGQEVEPWLATSHEVSSDELTYTFQLRDGVTFSNGEPMTSDDVKFSIDQARKNEEGFGYLDAAIDKVLAPEPQVVVIEVKYPWAPLVADLALFTNAIVPKDYGGMSAEEFYREPIGTGPFMFGSWSKGEELTLEKNPNYWQEGKPYLDSVTWTVVNSAETRQLQLEGDQVHINEAPQLSSVEQLENTSGVVVELFPSTRTDFALMNQDYEPLADVHVRRAISYAIDREALVSTVLFGHGEVANSLLNPSIPYYDPNTPGIQYDMTQAAEEMSTSGYPDGFDLEIVIDGGDPAQKSQGEIFQAALEPLGINVTLRNTTDLIGEISSREYQMAFIYFTMDIADPDQLVSFSVDPSIAQSFFTGYENPDVIDLAKEAQQTVDPAAREELYSQIQAQVATDAPVAFLYYTPLAYSLSDEVHGFEVYPTGNFHLEDVYLSG